MCFCVLIFYKIRLKLFFNFEFVIFCESEIIVIKNLCCISLKLFIGLNLSGFK